MAGIPPNGPRPRRLSAWPTRYCTRTSRRHPHRAWRLAWRPERFAVAGSAGSLVGDASSAGGGVTNFGDTTFDFVKVSGNKASRNNDDILGPIKS